MQKLKVHTEAAMLTMDQVTITTIKNNNEIEILFIVIIIFIVII